MKILNIHGYKGNAHNSAYVALKAIQNENNIISPQLDYDSLEPEEVEEILRKQIVENDVDFIVGTSLGGFYAAVLSREWFHMPVILVNPCLTPFLHLPRLGFKGDIVPFIDMFLSAVECNLEYSSCIIGAEDEVIGDHQLTKTLFYNSRFRVVPNGKHSGATLPLEDYFKEIFSIFANKHKKKVPIYSFYPQKHRINILICSRQEIEAMISGNKFPENTAVISFYDPAIKHIDADYAHVDYSSVCDHVFFSELDDLDLEVLKDKGYTYDTYFTEADEIAKFIYEVYNSGMNIICQCEYGQSRSAGCAAAIMEHFYHTGISVFTDYRRYPNQVVYHKIFDALENYKKIH